MISIMELNNEEMKDLCDVIGYKTFRKYFQSHPGSFSQIKPGFRATSLKTGEICSLVSKNREKPFISEFIYNILNDMRSILQEAQDAGDDSSSQEYSLTMALLQTPFAEKIDLFFRIFQDEFEKERAQKIKEEVEKIREAQNTEEEKTADEMQDTSLEGQTDIVDMEADEFEAYVGMSDLAKSATSKMKDHQDEVHKQAIEEMAARHDEEMRDQSRRYETALAEKEAELTKVKDALQAAQSELNKLSQFDDSSEAIATEHQHISICEVIYLEYRGRPQPWLNRMADVEPNGIIWKFMVKDDIPRYFENRDRLYHRDGPTDAGSVGIWSWSSGENRDDPSKDYVLSQYEPHYSPIEVMILRGCSSIDDIAVCIKNSIEQQPTCETFVIAARQQGEQYVGVKCSKTQFDWLANGGKLKNDVIVLPVYCFSQKDVLRLGNDRLYFDRLALGIPCDTLRIKDPLEIVRDLVLTENTWSVFKQRGIAKREWQNFRSFLYQIRTDDLIEKIAAACACTKIEAGQYLSDFMDRAAEFIDGKSIEEDVLSMAIRSDPELMRRCKALIMADWEAENKAIIEAAAHDRDVIANQTLTARAEVEELRADYDLLEQKRDQIVEEIAQKEQFAANVEKKVTETIQRAQENAATFIANMAFLPRGNSLAPTEIVPAEKTRYIKGEAIDDEEVEVNRDWKDALDSIEAELMNAGVIEKYARGFAAFLYSCFLNHASILLCGPNAAEIADAFSAAIFGETAGTLELAGCFDSAVLEDCSNRIVKIVNPFAHDWISRLPEILGRTSNYFLEVYPFAEDVTLEPKGLFNCVLPVMTELLVDRAAESSLTGGRFAEHYTEFVHEKVQRIPWVKMLKTSPYFQSRLQVILSAMHAMLNDASSDWDMLFAGIPFAFMTMQLPELLEGLRDTGNRKVQISKDLLEMLEDTYGE